MTILGSSPAPLHARTPLVYAPFLSAAVGHNVFLKLETQQRYWGPFQMRSIDHAWAMARQRKGEGVHVVVASGAHAIVDRLRSLGADVRPTVGGWDACDAAAAALVNTDTDAVYVQPFIGDDVVRGHASLVEEIAGQFPAVAREAGKDTSMPDALCCSIGGGGLLQGLLLGLTEHAAAKQTSSPTHLIAMCTIGADSYARSLETEDEFVTLEDAHFKAMSLTCKACSPLAVQDGRAYASTGSIAGASASPSGKVGKYLTVVCARSDYAGTASWQYRRDSADHALLGLGCGAAPVSEGMKEH